MVAKAVLYSMFTLTTTAFVLFIIYVVFTPVMNTAFNMAQNFLHLNPNAVSSFGQTQINNIMSSANLQWNILITVAIVGCGAIIWIVIYRDEPVETNQDYEY